MLKVKKEVDLRGIYIKKEAKRGKTPTRYPIKTSAVRSTSHCRTWGTGSRKNLLKAHLECRNACLGQLKRRLRGQRWNAESTGQLQ